MLELRAVCRIVVDLGAGREPRRGTGFLISATDVLTAAHVVHDPNDAVRKVSGKVSVRFARLAVADSAFPTKGEVLCFNPKDDWALVRLDDPPPLTPFQARPLVPAYHPRWTTFGFSKDAEDAGQSYGGAVRTFYGDRIQLLVDEATAEGGIHAAGLSGSPVLVDGYVVGLVASMPESDNQGIPRGATLRAVPMTLVAKKLFEERGQVFTFPTEDPPFFTAVADWIKAAEATLPSVASTLGIPSPHGTLPVELAKQVAKEMMRQGITPTTEALKPLAVSVEERYAKNILQMSASMWLDVQALKVLWQLISDGTREKLVILLNATSHQIGDWYGLRAKCLERLFPGARSSFVVLTDGTGLHAQVEATLGSNKVWNCALSQVRERSTSHNYAKHPIVLIVPHPPPDPEEIAALHKHYPKVRFLLLVGSTLTESVKLDYPGVPIVEPKIPEDAEITIMTEYQSGLDELEWAYSEVT
ncbi:trypsin-like serine peptidase [Sorangium sp. So ce1153]|uniref:trypsin-like serine peptidase n=1 Tax=Sorangium sp. So ce1153 TaxID=3133333 RepID=UPI003F606F45